MGGFVRGDVVILPFPFSDLSGSKRRPALVIADLDGNDAIMCQITSRNRHDKHAVAVSVSDFSTGTLPIDSYVRANKIFTADKSLFLSKAGTLTGSKTAEVINTVVRIFTE